MYYFLIFNNRIPETTERFHKLNEKYEVILLLLICILCSITQESGKNVKN